MKTFYYILACAAALTTACQNNDADYDASGVFETTEVIVSAKANGEILNFNVEEGQNISANAVVGVIDTTQLALKRDQLYATHAATGSKILNEQRQLASLRQQIANQERERNRFAALVKEHAATQKQVDDLDYQIGVLQKQLSATEEQISSSNKSLSGQERSITAQVAQINDQIRNSVITCPLSGVVLAKYAEPGEYAAPGRALFKVSDVGTMKLRAYITAGQLTTVKIGQKVKVYADQGEDGRKEYNGTVTWIADKAEFTPKTIQTRDERANLVYAIKVEVKNDGLIKRGMYGEVKF